MAMPEWIKKELRTNFARASRAGRQAAKTEPRAACAVYDAKAKALQIELTNGAAIIGRQGGRSSADWTEGRSAARSGDSPHKRVNGFSDPIHRS